MVMYVLLTQHASSLGIQQKQSKNIDWKGKRNYFLSIQDIASWF